MKDRKFSLKARGALETFIKEIEGFNVADTVECINVLDSAEAAAVIGMLPFDRAVAVLDQPELRDAVSILARMPRMEAVHLLDGMADDRATDILNELDDETRTHLIEELDWHTRLAVQRLIDYPPETAGGMMSTEFVSVPSDWSVGETLAHVRKVEPSREMVDVIYLLDRNDETLSHVVTLRRLITGEEDEPVVNLASEGRLVSVGPQTDREDVARLIRRYNLYAVPVIDEDDRILGIVTVDDVIDAMIAETTEDAEKFGGMESLGKPYMKIGFFQMLRKRAGWLAVLFLGEMLTASAMQHYEAELEKAIVLTLFIPLIMSSGGNSGSQATSLLIRGLALQDVRLGDWWRVALRELPTGLTLGILLGLIGVVRIAVWQVCGFHDYGEHWLLVAATVWLALIGIVMFGSLSGSMLPFILQRLGFDPASASAPFVATLVDVTGLVIYFSVASLVLKGTLL